MDEPRTLIRRLREDTLARWVLLVPSALLFALFAIPLAALVLRSFGSDFLSNALSRQAFQALSLSVVTSSITTLVAMIFGTPLAYLLSRSQSPPRAWIELILDLPIVLPPSVAGLALLIAFGRNGLLGGALGVLGVSLPFTTAAVVIAQTFVAAPLYVRSARVGFKSVEPELIEAAHVEGANAWQLFREVMVPIAGRVLASGLILTWTRALGEFGATILFAGNLEGVTQTMPMAIYLGFERNLGVALALAVVLIAVSVVLLALTKRLEAQS
ncbi:MAG TPA: ABC transporter permease [Anaerolineales bacterium]|nr:ABC transporter permease [Anaerolineales bacterium]